MIMGEFTKVDFWIPDRCPECGFENFKFHGDRTYGKLFIQLRCMRCGKICKLD